MQLVHSSGEEFATFLHTGQKTFPLGEQVGEFLHTGQKTFPLGDQVGEGRIYISVLVVDLNPYP